MISMSIAVIDDDEVDRTLLETLIQKSAQTLDINLNLSVFSDGQLFLESAESAKYDIVFMDIFMKGSDGIETAKQYRNINLQTFIVFLTASPEHRQSAFSVHAFDYIEKPVRESAIIRVLNDIKRVSPMDQQPTLTLTAHKQDFTFLYSDIQYVISDSNYIKIYTKQELRFRKNFSETEGQLLQDSRFFALNRGIIINLDWVDSVDEDYSSCTMKSNIKFPIARRKAALFKNRLLERHISE
ncbi:MAG: LytTR family DNA-binding domain-containing protein [Treponema sp.]|nr:LytTR family DNA-binding domain-containing protein [Treponema sp.]